MNPLLKHRIPSSIHLHIDALPYIAKHLMKLFSMPNRPAFIAARPGNLVEVVLPFGERIHDEQDEAFEWLSIFFQSVKHEHIVPTYLSHLPFMDAWKEANKHDS